MNFDYSVFFAYLIGAAILFIVGRVFVVPMKHVMKLLYNGILGGIALILLNLAAGLFEFHIALNAASALIAGLLGIPGVVLLVVLKFVFNA